MRWAQLLARAVPPATAIGAFWVALCAGCTLCLDASRDLGWRPVLAIGFGFLATGAGTAWAVRTLWLLGQSSRAARALAGQPWPEPLAAAVARTGARQVVCVTTDRLLAFCVGVLRPQVVVSSGLVGALRERELDAVLIHEEHHRRRREVLRRSAMQAAAEVAFALPLLRWLVERAQERSELAADGAAISVVGREPVAGAVLMLGSLAQPAAAAGFDGAATLRVHQLLGEPQPRQRPPASTCFWSGLGAGLLVALAVCVGQVLTAVA